MVMSPDIASIIVAKARQYGQDPAYMLRQAQIESGGNPNAQNPRSSAGGLYQFIDSTAQRYGLADKFDPEAASDAAARLARDNGAYLTKTLGRYPTSGELYLAHQQGMGGAAKLLSNPEAPAASLVGMKAVVANGGAPDETAAQFAGRWVGKFDGSGPTMSMPGGSSAPGAFGLSGAVAAGTPNSVAPASGATMEAPSKAEDSLDVGKLLAALQGAPAAAASTQAAPAQATPMPQMQAPQRRAQAFDPSAFYALLARKR